MAGKKKLSDEDKKQIIFEFNSGEKRQDLAKKYSISLAMVNYIIYPEKLATMREKAIKRPSEKAMNLERVHKWREKKKQS